MILALDIATRTGWAVGEIGGKPVFGTYRGDPEWGEGRIFSAFAEWLERRVEEFHVKQLFVEEAYVPRERMRFVRAGQAVPRAGPGPVNMDVIRRLIGLRAVARMVAWEQQARYEELGIGEIARHFTGHARWVGGRAGKKAATVRMARFYGFDVRNDDEADAVAIWMLGEARLGGRRPGPLFGLTQTGS